MSAGVGSEEYSLDNLIYLDDYLKGVEAEVSNIDDPRFRDLDLGFRSESKRYKALKAVKEYNTIFEKYVCFLQDFQGYGEFKDITSEEDFKLEMDVEDVTHNSSKPVKIFEINRKGSELLDTAQYLKKQFEKTGQKEAYLKLRGLLQEKSKETNSEKINKFLEEL